ncbi:MAG: DUF6010 family protein [Chloroflexota bacterium]
MQHQREIVGGILLAVILIIIAHMLPDVQRHEYLSMVLVGIATAYIGFAVTDGNARNMLVEAGAIVGFSLCAVVGLWLNPIALVVGYFGHGVWDMVHHEHGIQTRVTGWYIPLCVVVDWVMGAYIVWWLSTAPVLPLLTG